MNRKDLIKLLTKAGWWLAKEGGKHDIYANGKQSNQSPGIARSTRNSQKQSSGGRDCNRPPLL